MGEIWSLSAKSYRDAFGLLQRAGSTVAIAVLILAASGFVSIGADRIINTMLGRQVAGTLCNVAGIWFASPYLISLYRLLLDGKPVLPQAIARSASASRFFAWSAVLAFIAATPGYFFAAVMPPGFTAARAETPDYAYLSLTTFCLLVGVWIYTTRTITLLPAAALGVDMGIGLALQQTRGRFWFVVGAVTVPLLPVTLAGLLLATSTGGIFSIAISIAMSLAILILAIAVTANLYRWLVDHPK
jgi:hypothetical protein